MAEKHFEKETQVIYNLDKKENDQEIIKLIDNANKYANKGTPITISLDQKNNQVEFSVADLGEGLAEEEKKKVFEKFYRVGEENTRKTKGTGLGLYLCKKIVQGHGGKIFVSNNQPHGSIFTVVFKIT